VLHSWKKQPESPIMSMLDNSSLGIVPASDMISELGSTCDEHPQVTWDSEPGHTGNQVETSGLVSAGYLNQQLARQQVVIQTTISHTVKEQLAPLLEKMQVLIDSTSNTMALPRADSWEIAEAPVQFCDCEDSSVKDDEETSHDNTAASSEAISFRRRPSQLSLCTINSQSSIYSLSGQTECSMVSRVNTFLDDLSQPISQRVASFVKRCASLCQKPTHDSLLNFVESSGFFGFTGVLIILNSCFIGYQTDIQFKQAMSETNDPRTASSYLSRAFAALFLAELLLRLLARRMNFFTASDWKWNSFDAFLVVTSVMDEVMTSQVNFSATRILRVFRMARVLRIIRIVGAFRELREMLCSVISSLKSIFWALVLLCLVIYLFAILFMQSALNIIEQDGAQPQEFQSCWGSVHGAMYTLLAAISGGQDWIEAVAPFDNHSLFYRAFFSFFIVFVTFGMLNIPTGVFVARAAEISVLDKDLIIQAEIANTKSVVRNLRTMFQDLDTKHGGNIDIGKLTEYISRVDVQAYLAALNFHTSNTKELISMLDPQKTGQVGMNDFIAGCLQYKGSAKAVDVAILLYQHKMQSAKLNNLANAVETQMQRISQQIQVLRGPDSRQGTPKNMRPPATFEAPMDRQTHINMVKRDKVPRLGQPSPRSLLNRRLWNTSSGVEEETAHQKASNSEQTEVAQDSICFPVASDLPGQSRWMAL